VDRARELLSGKTIGLASGRYWAGTGASDDRGWLVQSDLSGGQLVEQATHTVDLLRCLCGDVEEVYAASARRVVLDIDCPDFHAVTMRFRSGALGSLTTTWAYAQNWQNVNVVDILYDNSRLTWSSSRLVQETEGETHEFTGNAPSIDSVFLQAVTSGDWSAIRTPYADAVETLRVTLALRQSAAEGRPVRLD